MFQILVQILVFVILGLLLFFLFRRGGLGCCGGHTDKSCACRGEADPDKPEYSISTKESDDK
jgi:hypothetical protein